MRLKIPIVLVACIFLALPIVALAEDDACSESCPDGNVVVSFADGNNVNCSCMPAAEMEATIEDPNLDFTSDNPT